MNNHFFQQRVLSETVMDWIQSMLLLYKEDIASEFILLLPTYGWRKVYCLCNVFILPQRRNFSSWFYAYMLRSTAETQLCI